MRVESSSTVFYTCVGSSSFSDSIACSSVLLPSRLVNVSDNHKIHLTEPCHMNTGHRISKRIRSVSKSLSVVLSIGGGIGSWRACLSGRLSTSG